MDRQFPLAAGGTTGTVHFGAAVAKWTNFGALSACQLELAPGETKSFTLTVLTPPAPGDGSGSVVLANAVGPTFAKITTVAIALRSLVPTPSPVTSFTGTLTGGNGWVSQMGQTAYYQLDLPQGERVLNAEILDGRSRQRLHRRARRSGHR